MTAKERDELRVLTEAWSNQVAVIVRDERARIRRELLAWISSNRFSDDSEKYWLRRDELRAALDRICPEEEG